MGIVHMHSAQDMFTIPEDTSITENKTVELLQASTPVIRPEPKSSAPVPKIDQPSKTVVSDATANHTEPLQTSTPVVTLESKNSTTVTKIYHPSKIAVSDTATNHTELRQASMPVVKAECKNSAPQLKIYQPLQTVILKIGAITGQTSITPRDRSIYQDRGNSTRTSMPEPPELPPEPGYAATTCTAERAADS